MQRPGGATDKQPERLQREAWEDAGRQTITGLRSG